MGGARRPARTVLEQRIQELRQTQEEFAEYATSFAQAHNEPATLSARHLQRLVSGRIGPPRAPTARLLERIFGAPIGELLAPPPEAAPPTSAEPLRVAVAVVRKDSEVLLVSPRTIGIGTVGWQFPAGIVKPGLSPEIVAVRETFEETAVRCVVERNLGRRVHPATKVLCHYLLCDYVAGTPQNVDTTENADVTWISAQSLTTLIPAERIYRPVLDALSLVPS